MHSRNRLVLKGITKNVFAISLVSFLNDIASEMIYPIVPIFLTTVLGAPVTVTIGGTACITAALIFGRRLPALHREAGRIIVALQAADGEPPEEITEKPGILTPREI